MVSLIVQSKEGAAAGVGWKQGASHTWVALRLEGGWEEVALKRVLQVVSSSHGFSSRKTSHLGFSLESRTQKHG